MNISLNANLQNQPLGRIDNLETRLAQSADEIVASQRLRYKVFYEEMSARPDKSALEKQLDRDPFDKYCDHLLVLDRSLNADNNQDTKNTVGTYRLLGQQRAKEAGGFYSAGEFQVDDLINRHPEKKFLEFGRSCVLPSYRTKRTIELLWQGSWAYVRRNNIDVMFGCASLEGTNPNKFSQALSFLYHHARAKNEWCIRASSDQTVEMNRIDAGDLNKRTALAQLPPLIKGYLRLGAMIGEEAVIDYQFGTIDIMIILPISHLNPRYVKHYGQNGERYRPVLSEFKA